MRCELSMSHLSVWDSLQPGSAPDQALALPGQGLCLPTFTGGGGPRMHLKNNMPALPCPAHTRAFGESARCPGGGTRRGSCAKESTHTLLWATPTAQYASQTVQTQHSSFWKRPWTKKFPRRCPSSATTIVTPHPKRNIAIAQSLATEQLDAGDTAAFPFCP